MSDRPFSDADREPWLEEDPLDGKDVFGAPSAMRCYFGDCKAAWCEPDECLREILSKKALES